MWSLNALFDKQIYKKWRNKVEMRSHACTLFGREYIIIELVVLRMLDWSKILLDAGNKNYKEDLSITYLNVSVKTYRTN